MAEFRVVARTSVSGIRSVNVMQRIANAWLWSPFKYRGLGRRG